MNTVAQLAVALTLFAVVAGAVEPAWAGPMQREAVTLDPAGQPAANGTVNLEGFARPLVPGALGSTPVQTTMVSVGGVNVGALSEFGSATPGRSADASAGGRGDSGIVGGYAGYRFASEDNPRSGYGVSLRVGADQTGNADTWRVQPGVDYTTPLGASWQFNSRLFSTYNLDGTSASGRGFAGGEERGFRDIGLGVGVGYAPSDRWTVQTQATYAMPLRSQDKSRSPEEGDTSNEFFGGVILNYKF